MKRFTTPIFILCLFVLAILLFGIGTVFGADSPDVLTAAESAPPSNWLISLLTPLLIAGVKLLIPKIPKPLLPILAPVFGALLQILANSAGWAEGNVFLGAILGAAGVAVREAVDQSKKALT